MTGFWSSLLFWFTTPATWMIFGVILLIFEITLDGSKVVFLPLGLAAMTVGLILYLQNCAILPTTFHLITSWGAALLCFALLGLIFSLILRKAAQHRHIDNTPDVNDY